ncbi:MAG: hypothetical protein Q9195_000919 [Heterodermia aff. obscurata]
MSQKNHTSPHKRRSLSPPDASPQPKRAKLLLDDENSDSDCSQMRGVSISKGSATSDNPGFTVNEEFARRFEHNKKREELHRLEERYGKRPVPDGAGDIIDGSPNRDTESSSESEDEDEEGILASGALDAQIDATLKAIRMKDPRVYDEKATFYTELDDDGQANHTSGNTKPKPMYLSDYHRRNLLENANDTEELDQQPATYTRQQDDLRSIIVQEMHAAAEDSLNSGAQNGSHDGDSDDDFLVRKPSKPDHSTKETTTTRIELDVENADKDPDNYLSNFLAARAWLPSAGAQIQPFESDDEEADQRAEAFEEAYNMRFENPQAANEKLMSHARDTAAKYSVRKESANSRKKARDAERARRELEKQEREEEKARLRKLQIAEAGEKVRKIKQAAGLRGEALKEEDWSALLNEGWDNVRWEVEMKKRFGDEYYADHEPEDGTEKGKHGRRKPRKPKWDEDIDIDDLVPDFEADEEAVEPYLDPTDDDTNDSAISDQDPNSAKHGRNSTLVKDTRKHRKVNFKRERIEQKQEARKERRVIEKLVDEKLNAEDMIAGVGRRKTGHFRYRETSPLAFGLTPQDILMASDSQLNQYVGLKKMASFRDSEKKRRDKKRLGKKARLREWRKETFGSERGPPKRLPDLLNKQDANEKVSSKSKLDQSIGIKKGKKRRKQPKREETANGESKFL